MQNCKHKTVQDGKTSFCSVFRVSCEFAPSQLARLRCSNNLAYRFSSERLLAVYVRVQKGSFRKSTTTTASEFVYYQTLSRLLRVSMGWWHLRLSAKILALLRLSVNFFSVTVNERVKN